MGDCFAQNEINVHFKTYNNNCTLYGIYGFSTQMHKCIHFTLATENPMQINKLDARGKKKGGTPIQIEGVSLFFPIVQFGAVAKANVITSIRNPTGSD